MRRTKCVRHGHRFRNAYRGAPLQMCTRWFCRYWRPDPDNQFAVDLFGGAWARIGPPDPPIPRKL